MDIALLSILALVVAILIGVWRSDINVGIVSLAFAFGIALFSPGLDVAEIPSFLPSDLLLMLIGVTLTFGMIRANGTLDWMANGAVGAVRSKPAFLPIIFFLLTFILSAIGPGNIAATAIIAPIGMAVASRAGISPMLMAIMICTGANAAAFSPIAPTGVINTELLKSIGITDPGVPLQVFLGAAGLQTVTALFAWVLFGRKRTREVASKTTWFDSQPTRRGTKNDYLMLVAILILLLMVLVFQVGIGASTIIVGLLLALFRIGDLEEGIKSVPWNVILLIGGIYILIRVMEVTGGIDKATSMMTEFGTPESVNGMLAFTTGILSVFSSSSGVVIPLYIPLLPSLAQGFGITDIVSMAIAVDIGSHLVDVSPLSSLGALCLAAIQDKEERKELFHKLLLWGLAMGVVGGILAFIFLDLL
ncbi:MAG: hypothetical protein KDD67_06700 [Ignavibacteriae bacterium]|nr:hypothetical protein [Ignavibacteriota bacterium]MCB9215626.1 hypothetical protein [Ignavibacteria bacterium]